MGWFRPRNPGPRDAFQAVYRDVDGRQRSRKFPAGQKTLARRWLREQESKVDRGEWQDPAAGRILFRDWVAKWESTRTIAPTTRASEHRLLRVHHLKRFGDKPLIQIRRSDVQSWLVDLVEAGYTNLTIRKLYGLMQQIMDAAVDDDLIARSPCRKITINSGKPKRVPTILTPEQADRLINSQPKPGEPGLTDVERTLLLTMIGTGLRWGEAAGLLRRNIQLLTRPGVSPTLAVAEQLRSEPGGRRRAKLKTQASENDQPLPAAVAAALAAVLPANGGRDDPVFVGPGGKPLHRSGLTSSRRWRLARARAGAPDLEPHDLRRTGASWLEDAGLPRIITETWLRHATNDPYIRAMPEITSRVLEALDERLPTLRLEPPEGPAAGSTGLSREALADGLPMAARLAPLPTRSNASKGG